MNWQPIITQPQADAFMHLVGDFHDGCSREMEHYVVDDLAMGRSHRTAFRFSPQIAQAQSFFTTLSMIAYALSFVLMREHVQD